MLPKNIIGTIKKNAMQKPRIGTIGIYKITSPSGKVYIGQSTNIEKRRNTYSKLYCKNQPKLYNSLNKYGWKNHIHEIIEECSVEQLDERELYWGNYYNVLDKKGLNLRLGNGKGKISDDVKYRIGKSNSRPKPQGFGLKVSISNIGKKRSEESKSNQGIKLKGRTSPNKNNYWSNEQKNNFGIKIIQYDLNGNFIKEWDTISSAIRETGFKGINENINNRTKSSGGYIWMKFINNYPKHLDEKTIEIANSRKPINNKDKLKPIIVLNQNLELLYEFNSITEAAFFLKKIFLTSQQL